MSSKSTLIGMTVGSLIGGYVPILWGSSLLSFSSVLWAGIGGIIGVYIAYKISQEL